MTRRCVAVTVALLGALALSASLHARQTPSKVKVVVFGGFLGFLDGLYELPAGDHDDTTAGPSGGLIGVKRQLAKGGYDNALRLVTANNMPRYTGDNGELPTSAAHPFWKLLASVNPAAVAIGVEDIAHALSETDGASHLVQLMQKPQLPFIASNVFIRTKSAGMNAVRQGGYHLEVSADESLDLLRRLTVACDKTCANEEVATLEDLGLLGQGAAAVASQIKASPEADQKHWTIDLKTAPLRPGRQYRLSIHGVVFTFHTVAALTPQEDGLPVLTLPNAGVTYRVMGFVEPDILAQFPDEHLQWKRGARNAAACPGETCEIVVASPSSTWTSLAPYVPHGAKDGVLTAMLDLDDDTSLELLQLGPSFRVVTLPPDTTLLGRAAAARKGFGGDLGYNAVVDSAPSAGLMRVLMRPEWLAETVHTFEADASLVTLKDREPLLALTHPATSVKFVAGAPLRATLEEGHLQYFVTDEGVDIKVGGPYRAYPKHDGKGMIFGSIPIRDLWTDSGSMTAFLLELVREKTKADIAVLDDLAVDGSISSWLASELKQRSPVEFLSRFVLERAMFRPSRVVRVTVQGSQIASSLSKIVTAAKSFDSKLFMSGIGSKGRALSRVDSDTLKINEREINPAHFYSIALPQRYVAEVKATREERPLELENLMKEADRALGEADKKTKAETICVTRAKDDPNCGLETTAQPPRPDEQEGSLATDLEGKRAGIPRRIFAMGKASIEWSGLRSNETSDLALSAVPEDGRDGTKYENRALSVALEPGVSTRRGILLSLPLAADYSHKQVGKDVIKETYPANSWSAAVKVAKTVHSVPFLHSLFSSAGFQSNFVRPSKAVTSASADSASVIAGSGASATTSVTSTKIALTSTPFPRPTQDFTISGGAEFEDAGKDATLKFSDMAIGVTKVHRARDLVGLTAAGREITADQLAADSAQTIINRLFKTSPDVVKDDPTVNYKFAGTRFSRMDVSATGTLLLRKDKTHPWPISLANKYRWYFPGGTPRLIAARHTLETKLKASIPLGWRVEVAPYLNAFWLKLRNDGRTFQVFEYGLKVQFPLFASRGPGRAHR